METAVAVAVLMLTAWLVSLVMRDASIVDVVWGFGFVVIAWVAYVARDETVSRALLLAGLTTVWGLRLTGYLAWRNLGKGEDYRYAAMRKRYGSRFPLYSLVVVFGLQGVLMWLVSTPVQFGMDGTAGLGLLDAVGAGLWAVGLLFEAVGDYQLARFKADSANAGTVMNRGLWRFTRHPNYFGDFLVWWGLYLVAVAGSAWWTAFGPLLMTVLLMKVSGAGLLEKTIGNRRPGYAAYVASTNAFFPGPPRKPSS
jgi:steroid 5-alpha reductase family enzyme